MYSKEEAKQLREDFWIEFNNKSGKARQKLGKPRKWTLYKTGIKGVELKFNLSQKEMSVMIEIFHRNVYKRLEVFEKFEQVKKLINDTYIGELTWDDEVVTSSGKQVCWIYEELQGVNIHRQEQWPEMIDWLKIHMLSLEEALDDVHDFLKPQIEEVFED